MEKKKDSLGRNHTGRSTAATKEFRVATIYKMLTDGKPRSEIVRFCAEEWSIASRQVDNYIRDARTKLEEDCTISRQEFLAEAIVGLRSIRQQAEKRGQYQVAVNTVRLMTELVGLDGKSS